MRTETVGIKVITKDRSGREVAAILGERPGCRVWPRRSAEGDQGRVVLSGWNVHFPPGPPIPSDARLVVRGNDYSIFGQVADYSDKGMIAQCRSVGDV